MSLSVLYISAKFRTTLDKVSDVKRLDKHRPNPNPNPNSKPKIR